MRKLTLYRDDSTSQVVFENVKHHFWLAGNTVLCIAQYTDLKMWAAISEDVPPEIWEVGFYKEPLQSNLRKIRVVVSPVVRRRKAKP